MSFSQSQPCSHTLTPNTGYIPDSRLSQSDCSFNDDQFIDEIDCTDYKEEQNKIEKTLNFLLNFNATNKRTRGRPPKNPQTTKTSPLKVPESVNDELKSFTNINDLHPGVLLDYLKKVNNLNKKILKSYDILNNKYNELSAKVNEITINQNTPAVSTPRPIISSDQSIPVILPPASVTECPSHTITNNFESNTNNNIEIHLKIDAIEQKNNSNILLCAGDIANDIINLNESNSNLKSNFIEKVKKIIPAVTATDVERVYTFGKNKKTLKVIWSSTVTRNNFLSEIKKLKPTNIYFSEFLTTYRNKLFYELRQLRRKYPTKITAAYTREGNIYFKSSTNNKFNIVRTTQDILNLTRTLENDQ